MWLRTRPLVRALLLVLVLKCLGLALVWRIGFSEPLARHMRVPVQVVADHVLSSPSDGESHELR